MFKTRGTESGMVSLWAVTVFTAPSNRPLGQEEKARHGPAFHCTGTRST